MVRLFRKVAVLLTVFMVVLQVMAVPLSGVSDSGIFSNVRVVSVVEAAPQQNSDTSLSFETTGKKVDSEDKNTHKVNLGSSGVLKSIEDKFKEISIQGVARLRPHVITLICVLWIISFTTNWSLYEGQMRISMIIGSIMKVGFFLWLALNWETLADDIFTSLENIGLVASGSNLTGTEFTDEINGSTIIDRGFASVWELFSSLSAFSPIVSLLKIGGIFLILFSHFWIAFEVFITRVEFRIFECLAFVFMPFGMFQATSFLFQKCVSGVFGYGAKLMVMTFLVGLCESQVNWQSKMGADGKLAENPLGLTAKSTYGDCFVVGVSLLLLAYLVSKAGELAAGVTSGQPSMSGAGVRGALGSVAKGVASVAAAGAIATAATSASAASTAGAGASEAAGAAGKVGEAAGAGSMPTGPATTAPKGSFGGMSPSPVPAGAPGSAGTSGGGGGTAGGGIAAGTSSSAGTSGGGGGTAGGGIAGGGGAAGAPGSAGTFGGGGGTAGGGTGTGGADDVKAAADASTKTDDGGKTGAAGMPSGEGSSDAKSAASGSPAGDGKKSEEGSDGGEGKAPKRGEAGWAASKLAAIKAKPSMLMAEGKKKAADLISSVPGGQETMDMASKAKETVGGIKADFSKGAQAKAEGIGKKVQSAKDAINRSPLESADRAAAGFNDLTDSNKSTMERLKGGAAMAGNVAAIAGHGMKKVTGSRAARIAKETGKILGRAALMRNPVTAVFYGEFNKMRNDYLQMQQFKVTKNIDDQHQEHMGRAILHPDWERKNQN